MGLAVDSGVLVQEVIAGGAAERAGIHGGTRREYIGNTPVMLGGDLIVAIDGQEVTDPQDISAIMDKHQAGDTVSVTIYRGRREMTLKLILGEAHSANG
jgi:S1-C subfamily serine protease